MSHLGEIFSWYAMSVEYFGAYRGLSGRPDKSITMVITGKTICRRIGTKNAAGPLFVPRPKFVH
jgi:hypothetical protein